MIPILTILVAAFSLIISLPIVLIGKNILHFYPSIKQLDHEEPNFSSIVLTKAIVDQKGESVFAFAKKDFKREFTKNRKDFQGGDKYFDRFKIGQVITIAFYYQDKKFDKEFVTLQRLCVISFILALIVLGNILFEESNNHTIVQMLNSFNADYFKFYSLSQAVTFIILLSKIIFEKKVVDRLFNPRSF